IASGTSANGHYRTHKISPALAADGGRVPNHRHLLAMALACDTPHARNVIVDLQQELQNPWNAENSGIANSSDLGLPARLGAPTGSERGSHRFRRNKPFSGCTRWKRLYQIRRGSFSTLI